MATLGLGLAEGSSGAADAGAGVVFDLEDGKQSRDFGGLCTLLTAELGRRALAGSTPEADGLNEGTSSQDWARASFAVVMAGLYNAPSSCGGGAALPAIVAKACEGIQSREMLDAAGWAQFFLYQTIYCADVERPDSEIAVKKAVPMWIQERLHERWLDSIVLLAQPQGADDMQRDVEASLKRTNTQSLLNCSAGRDWDEQHCWFAGFHLSPRVSIECDSMVPMGPGRPRPSGWLAMKTRLLKQMGYTVATFHRCFWEQLTEDQKDEQIMRLRAHVGYVHDRELEKRQRPIRQTAHTYKGLESKRKDWKPRESPEE